MDKSEACDILSLCSPFERQLPQPQGSLSCDCSKLVLDRGGSGGEPPVYVQAYSTLDLPGLVDFLKGVDDKVASAVALCAKIWYHYKCEKGHEVYKPRLCRQRRFCPRDAEAYVKSRVAHAYEVFKRLEIVYGWRIYLIHIVFTLPKDLWIRVVENPDPFFEAVYEALKYEGGMSGGVASLHLIHSSRPLDGWYPHIHVIVPNVVLIRHREINWIGGARVRASYFKRTRPFFNESGLKERYRSSIKRVFGVDVEDVDVYVSYVRLSDKKKAKHRLRYAFRMSIQDLAPYLNGSLNDEVKEFVLKVLNYPFERIRWFGWLAKGVVGRYLPGYVKLSEFLRKVEDRCPICHTPLHFVEYLDRPPPPNGG